MAENLAWKSSATSIQSRMRMDGGSFVLRAGTQLYGFMSISGGGVKWATWPSAWTPASVLPDPWTGIVFFAMMARASAIVSWTVE